MTDLLTIAAIAIGLGIDCFAVSITRGVLTKKDRLRTASVIALFFGFFQGGMCLIGWGAGEAVVETISGIDHWIAFGLLAIVGFKMLVESRKDEEERDGSLGLRTLLALSLATSMDSLAVGLSFAFLKTQILMPAAVIGAASFMMSMTGFYLGGRASKGLGRKAEFIGGLVLIGIGLRILLEHLTA